MTFPSQHRTKLHATNPLRAPQQGGQAARRRRRHIFPNEESIVRLIGAVLLEAHNDWQLQHRYMQIEGMAELTTTLTDDARLALTPQAA